MSHLNQRLGVSLARLGFAAFAWLGTALCCFVASPASAASAQRDRVFVASYGSDSNPCTFGSPCKTFQQAVNVVADSGEVTAIDSAGFGPILIQKSVAITSPVGVEAGITAPAGQSAIVVDGTNYNTQVTLRGLTLEGSNVANYGVYVDDASVVQIIDCTIRDFMLDGVHLLAAPDVQNFGIALVVTNSNILNNAQKGIYVGQDSGEFKQYCYFDLSGLTIEDNNTDGVFVDSGCGGALRDSFVSNGNRGVVAQGTSSLGSFIYLGNVTLNNSTADVFQYNYTEVDMSGVNAILSTNSGTPLNDIVTATDFTNHITISNIPISTFSRH